MSQTLKENGGLEVMLYSLLTKHILHLVLPMGDFLFFGFYSLLPCWLAMLDVHFVDYPVFFARCVNVVSF